MPRAQSPSGWLRACGVGYTPRRDGATRRAVSTQLVVNPVCAHYRRHVTPGVCRRGGTLRRGSPGLSIAWSDRKLGILARKRQELLEPGGFLLIAWLARARAVPQSHVPVRERRCAAARMAGRTLRTAGDRDQRSVMWRRCPAVDQRQAPAPCNFKGESRVGEGTRRGGCACGGGRGPCRSWAGGRDGGRSPRAAAPCLSE